MAFDDPAPQPPAGTCLPVSPVEGLPSAIPSVIPVVSDEADVILLTDLDSVRSVIPVEPVLEMPPPPPVKREPDLLTRFLCEAMLPPRSKPPYPGMKWRLLWALPMLFWSTLWSVAFILVNLAVSLVVILVTLFVAAFASADRREYFNSLFHQPQPLAQVAKAEGKAVPRLEDQPPIEKVPPDPQPAADNKAAAKKAPQFTAEFGKVLMPAMIAVQIALVLCGWGALRLTSGPDWARQVGLRRPSFTQGFIAILGLPGLMIVATAAHALARRAGLPGGDYQEQLVGLFDAWPVWFGVLAVGLGPGLSEELWCRGFLGRGLVGRFGFLGGMLVVSLLFGAMHMDPPHIVATAIMGMALHFTYLMTRSLWVPMVLHTVNNSTGVIMTKISGLRDADPTPDKAPWYLYAAAVLLLAAVAYALYRSRPRLVGEDGGPSPWLPEYPGVAHPPRGSGAAIHRPWPGWLASGLVALAVTGFVGSVYLVSMQEQDKPAEAVIAPTVPVQPS